jgi:hypothetical protein
MNLGLVKRKARRHAADISEVTIIAEVRMVVTGM